jgi:hypothetical protein
MLERNDIEEFTEKKQEIQLLLEILFGEMMQSFDLDKFLKDPRGYTKTFLLDAASKSLEAASSDAMKLGEQLAKKAAS